MTESVLARRRSRNYGSSRPTRFGAAGTISNPGRRSSWMNGRHCSLVYGCAFVKHCGSGNPLVSAFSPYAAHYPGDFRHSLSNRQRKLSVFTLPDVRTSQRGNRIFCHHGRWRESASCWCSHGCHLSASWKDVSEKVKDLHDGNQKSGEESRTERDRVVGAEIFEMLRQRASTRRKTLPEKLQLHFFEIRFADGQVHETRRVLFAE